MPYRNMETIDAKLANIATWIHAKAIQNIDDARAIDRGTLKQMSGVEKVGDKHYRIFFRAAHAPFVEFGSRPHRPPAGPLIAWAARHGKPAGMGYAVVNKIAKEGTPAIMFLKKALLSAKAEFGSAKL